MSGQRLIEVAETRTILSDGAMGTQLQERGLVAGICPELWNVECPDDVKAVHLAYLDAGSTIISTNTFGGNGIKLQAYGLSGRVHELNKAGAALARVAAGPVRFVAASVGPTGKFLEPLGEMTPEECADVFEQQARALADGGADVILLETFSDLDECRAALAGALRAGILCFCTLAFDTGGRTMMGVDPETAAVQLTDAGAAGVGANCGVGPADTLDVVRKMREVVSAIVIAQPNAGVPQISGGRTVYDSTPEEMAAYAVRFAQLGVNIVGGCCGSTPAHIRAMSEALATQ